MPYNCFVTTVIVAVSRFRSFISSVFFCSPICTDGPVRRCLGSSAATFTIPKSSNNTSKATQLVAANEVSRFAFFCYYQQASFYVDQFLHWYSACSQRMSYG